MSTSREDEITFMTCCGKYICIGCIYKSVKNDKKNGLPEHEVKCAFCRQPPPKSEIKALKKLMKKNNPIAFIYGQIIRRGGRDISK